MDTPRRQLGEVDSSLTETENIFSAVHSTKTFFNTNTNCQVTAFTVATIAWILCSISMGLVEWRMLYTDDPVLSYSFIVGVGMWRLCIYHHENSSNIRMCHQYSYRDTFLPVDIRITQHLLLATSILGLLAKVLSIFALKSQDWQMDAPQRYGGCSYFIFSGLLNIAAGGCVFLVVFWNYYAIMNTEGIHFPPSFHMPFKPNIQEVGSAMMLAGLAAFLMLLSGTLFLSYRPPFSTHRQYDV